MIYLLTLLGAMPLLEKEFEEFSEHIQLEESFTEKTEEELPELVEYVEYQASHADQLVAEQENRNQLLTYIHEFSQSHEKVVDAEGSLFYFPPNPIPAEIEMLMEWYALPESTVVDFGAERGASTLRLSQLVGPKGRVIGFESQPESFRELFWNLALNHITNVELYCSVLEEKEKKIDLLHLKKVSLIKINDNGKGAMFLNKAHELIYRDKPVIIINMAGGIPIERTDRFVSEIFRERMEQLKNWGYSVQRINNSDYLALPK